MYYSFALAGHRGTCLRPLHIFALLLLFAHDTLKLKTFRRRLETVPIRDIRDRDYITIQDQRLMTYGDLR